MHGRGGEPLDQLLVVGRGHDGRAHLVPRLEQVEQPQQRRLAGAPRARQEMERAGREREGDVTQHLRAAAVAHPDIVEANHGWGANLSRGGGGGEGGGAGRGWEFGRTRCTPEAQGGRVTLDSPWTFLAVKPRSTYKSQQQR